MNNQIAMKLESNNVSSRVVSWVMAGAGDFSESDIFKSLDLFDAQQKEVCSQTLKRLLANGEIESIGTRYGWYRRVDRTLDKIDWRSASTEEFPLILPFHLHDQARTFPKSVIVVSGEKNTGKSAFCLNIVELNQNRFLPILDSIAPIYYFSSEMLAPEFKVRLQGFSETRLDDWNFEAIHRTENFEDVIQPDAINIIDFLEIHDQFWKIGQSITNIWKRLNNGVAVVCVQKGDGKEHGRGGSFLVEKPRLTVNLSKRFTKDGKLDGATLKVTNCKFPVMGRNPNGKSLDYHCSDGAKLSPISGWYYETEKN